MQTIFNLLMACSDVAEMEPAERLYQELKKVEKAYQEEGLKEQLIGEQGPINGTVAIRAADDSVNILVDVKDGVFNVSKNHVGALGKNSATLIFASEQQIREFMQADIEEEVKKFLRAEMVVEGNPAHFVYFNYLLSQVYYKEKIKMINVNIDKNEKFKFDLASKAGKPDRNMRKNRIAGRLKAETIDPGVHWLKDPYLSAFTLDDFDRVKAFKQAYLSVMPEITSEQGEHLTDFYVQNGYDINKQTNKPWNPMVRSAEAFNYLMTKKRALIRENDLLAGTMTPNPICGCITQPYTVGWKLWGDLKTIAVREDEPFAISQDTIEILHRKVYPFWMNKHIESVWKSKVSDDSDFVRTFNRKFFMIPWGLVSLNPGCPGLGTVVQKGLDGLKEDINMKLEELHIKPNEDREEQENQINSLTAMKITLDGMSTYAKHLSEEILNQANKTSDLKRKDELMTLHEMLSRVPDEPAQTLHEAFQVMWIMFIGIGLDSMNDTMSVGRLDQIMQPYFEADIEKLHTDEERETYIKEAIELTGCFFMKLNSHRIATDTMLTWQHSGAPADTSIVVGGVTPDGKDAVNDMSYIILKVTEMLSTDDPDMDVRFMPNVNSRTFLKRVAEVNYITSGTPSVHNDAAVIHGWQQNNKDWAIEDIRNWAPCGCVEPVMMGKHFAASADLDSNLTVPLEMALNNGKHIKWNRTAGSSALGPETGEVDSFNTFDEFFGAFKRQFEHLYDHAIIDGSYKILETQKEVMPAPFYSTLLDGCIQNGKGMLDGGAKYNTAGSSLIGLSDVIDSLIVIKQLVFDEQTHTFTDLKEAVDKNFEGELGRRVYADARHRVQKFGSGDANARQMADRVTRMIGDYLHSKDNGRGGKYIAGYKTTSNHTVFGMVSGAFPSGRRAFQPFTSGLTPSPTASKNLLDNLMDVASLDPATCENNFAFNVRLSFSKNNTHEENINRITQYLEAYFKEGGMQVQLNMVDSDTLRDAMANPEEYEDLIVRISGYTGFYTKMQRDLQLEVIGRTEFAL